MGSVGCRQATWVAQTTTAVSALATVAMLMTANVVSMDIIRVWLFLKGYTVLRIPFIVHRAFFSSKGPFGTLWETPRVDVSGTVDLRGPLMTQPAVNPQ